MLEDPLKDFLALRSSRKEHERIEEDKLLRQKLADIILSQRFVSSEKHVNLLKSNYDALHKLHHFIPGQLVKWKQGLRNKKLPRLDEPAVVVEVLDRAIVDTEREAGSPYFREPLDLVLGLIDPSDGDFVIFYYDGRRFEPFTE